jgi:dihydrodipicolinate synthase/N-acetylneuraminate lyase
MLDLHGLFVPVPTPYTDDGSALSEVRLARFVRGLLQKGLDGLVVGGETSEYQAITYAERKHLLELVSRSVPAGTPVIANVSSQSTVSSVELAQQASNFGARAVIAMPPFGNYYSDKEIRDHFHRIAQYGHLPVLIVDPNARLDDGFREELAQIPGLLLASPLVGSEWSAAACFSRSTTDEFAHGRLYSLPIALFGIDWRRSCENGTFDALRELIHIFGPARVLKSAAESLDLELGPLRGPLQPLPQSSQDGLHRLIQLAA